MTLTLHKHRYDWKALFEGDPVDSFTDHQKGLASDWGT